MKIKVDYEECEDCEKKFTCQVDGRLSLMKAVVADAVKMLKNIALTDVKNEVQS